VTVRTGTPFVNTDAFADVPDSVHIQLWNARKQQLIVPWIQPIMAGAPDPSEETRLVSYQETV
jgi:hypothetical protein